MNTNKLLIITRDQQQFYDTISNLHLEWLEIFAPMEEKEIINLLPEADIILVNALLFTKYVNRIRDGIRVQSTFTWIDALISEELKTSYTLTNIKDVYGPIMSEYVFWYILLREKNILRFLQKQEDKTWDYFAQWTLVWKTIGFLWTGSIAQPIASVAKVFGMKTKWYSNSWRMKESFDEVYTKEHHLQFCEWLDYLINILPNTPSTYNYIDNKFRDNVPNSCYFINVWRGSNVVEEELYEAVIHGKIAWATLDVFHQEPLSQESKLRNTPNIHITPHISWYPENIDGIVDVFTKNYKRYTNWDDLLYKIDFKKGY